MSKAIYPPKKCHNCGEVYHSKKHKTSKFCSISCSCVFNNQNRLKTQYPTHSHRDTIMQAACRVIVIGFLPNAPEEYVDALIHGYKGVIPVNRYWNYNKHYLPKKGSRIPLNYILDQCHLKTCTGCQQLLSTGKFNSNRSTLDGLQTYCNSCQYSQTAPFQAAVMAKRKAAQIKRTPAWADLGAIKDFYTNCPKGYHVDHVVPLQGKNVSGFHVLENLQYLTARDNMSKGNRHVCTTEIKTRQK